TPLDFQTQSSYDVTVQVDDPGVGATPDDTAAHTLTITGAILLPIDDVIPPPEPETGIDPPATGVPDEGGNPESEAAPPSDGPSEPLAADPGEPLFSPAPTTPDVAAGAEGVPDTLSIHADDRRETRDGTPAAGGAIAIFESLLANISPGTSLSDLIFVGQKADFLRELDRLSEGDDARAYLEEQLVGSTIAVSTGLSVGYVIWLTRGGLLLTSLLSSMPAWRLIDPIPILARRRDDELKAEEEEESLDSLVRGGSSTEPAAPDHDSVGRGAA
ncbi:MAG: hypothetical protein V3T24_00010, partial [Longimicrobiales bacterium]